MPQSRQRLSRVLGYLPIAFSGRTKRLLGAVLALPVAWIALGWADHSQFTALIWLFSPGLPIAIHVPVAASGLLDGIAKVAMIALLIDSVYYAALIFGVLSCFSRLASERQRGL